MPKKPKGLRYADEIPKDIVPDLIENEPKDVRNIMASSGEENAARFAQQLGQGIKNANKTASQIEKDYLERSRRLFEKNPAIGISQMPLHHRDTLQKPVNFASLTTDVVFPSGDFTPGNIVITKDRPGAEVNGYGAINPGGRSETVDIVVGRHSAAFGGKGPKKRTKADPNFFTDAARIYISQMTNVDLNFGVSQGYRLTNKISQAKSAIAVKADGVRIIGREGVKIVTGKARHSKIGPKGETNSFGGKLEPSPPIELIAGNNGTGSRRVMAGLLGTPKSINYLQPALLGESTVDCLNEVFDMLDQVNSACFNLSLIFAAYCSINGIDPFRPWIPPVSGIASTLTLNAVSETLWSARINSALARINYLEEFGYNNIASRNVYIT